jgi:lysine-specific demethylase 8
MLFGGMELSQPRVERGAASDWPAASWTFASLADRLGAAKVPVHTGRWKNGALRVVRDGATVQTEAGPWLESLEAGQVDEGYMAGFELFRRAPGLRQELGFPDVGVFYVDVAWIGPGGIVTPLHNDSAPNLYAQLVGRKRWRIWPPDAPMKPRLAGVGFTMSGHDVHRGVDDAGEPALDIVLEPGDVLALPPRWWHRVDTLEPSIAVNRWWRAERLGKLVGRVLP